MQASTKIFRNLARALTGLGFDPAPALHACGLRLVEIESEEGLERRVPVAVLDHFWVETVALTKDPAIGVRIGSLGRIESFGALGYIATASSTLGDALLRTARYLKLWNEATSISLLVEGESGLLWYRSLSPDLKHPAAADAFMTLLLAMSRQLTGEHLVPLEARFAHEAAADSSVYRDVYGCAPAFDQLEYGLVFSPDVLTLPVATRGSDRTEAFARQLGELENALPLAASLATRVRDMLAAELRGGNPMIESIAAQLRMHPRTLTRRLREEGTSHSELLDSLRRELATKYMATELSVSEVAFLLGFSDASAFNKAFKRWSGLAPGAFRRQARR